MLAIFLGRLHAAARPSSGVSVILFPLSRYGLAYHLLCEVPVLVNLVLTQVLQGRRQPTHDFNQGPEFGHRDRVFHFLRREVRNSTIAQVHKSAVHFPVDLSIGLSEFFDQFGSRGRKHPGKFRDYLSVWDFNFDIKPTPGGFEIETLGSFELGVVQ